MHNVWLRNSDSVIEPSSVMVVCVCVCCKCGGRFCLKSTLDTFLNEKPHNTDRGTQLQSRCTTEKCLHQKILRKLLGETSSFSVQGTRDSQRKRLRKYRFISTELLRRNPGFIFRRNRVYVAVDISAAVGGSSR